MSGYHLDLWTWLNSVQMRTPTGSRWISNNYITRCHRRLESVSSSSVPVAVVDRVPAEWKPAPDRGLGPSVTHGWAAQPECERSAAMVRKTWGQYVAVCPRLQLTSHTQPALTLLRIKCERYIVIKKCVRSLKFVIIFDYVTHIFVYVYVCGYTTRVPIQCYCSQVHSTQSGSTW